MATKKNFSKKKPEDRKEDEVVLSSSDTEKKKEGTPIFEKVFSLERRKK